MRFVYDTFDVLCCLVYHRFVEANVSIKDDTSSNLDWFCWSAFGKKFELFTTVQTELSELKMLYMLPYLYGM